MTIYTNLNVFYRILISFFLGLVIGFIGCIIRLGWEVLFPNLQGFSINADSIAASIFAFLNVTPELLVQKIVFSSGYEWSVFYIVTNIMISITFGVIYSVIVEFCLKMKFAQGLLFAFLMWVVFFLIILPLFGFIHNFYADFKVDFLFLFNTLCECLLMFWIMELSRRDLRNRLISERDPI
ncbi:DUF1440 domain-containing protein [Helicobacter saguini]|uniref:DUF1440 domain-containing protein n=1 Tax=Helicobacter saguini TaxID=1548018 RepID=A0A6L7DJS0_9HELI|nr:DUF1440 domain-containing protein [Helicobacter saguini]MWV61456.1 DUF1440 domain-containing protein [Helicobacter saguini]MWV70658.1 DUF1440 domain-containing protein [Helicobacter saguini]MWV72563.1 DUF1440 domain-containing protein [Helicobacter saguini]